jgi:O-antigen/teichoic acid export membrane protein
VVSRVLWRRSATAIGVYAATIFGFFTTVVATRELGLSAYGQFAAVLAATTFVQQLLDLTVEESLVKYGFRYIEAERFGRLHRLFRIALSFKLLGGLLGALVLIALAPLAKEIWGTGDVLVPMTIAAALPLVQSPEGVAAGAIILRGRYDLRATFLAVSMAIRLAALAIGCRHGLTGAVVGLIVGQVIATAAISVAGMAAFRRFPHVPAESLGEDRRDLRRFVISSTLASSLDSGRATLGTALMPAVASTNQAAYFSNAQAPATGFAAASGPVRLVLLTEQTRDFEAGRHSRMYGMLRRYILGSAALMVIAVPVFWFAMPYLLGWIYGPAFRLHATDAARLVLLAAALQVIWGWTKSFPVSIGRPNLRLVAMGVEIAVFVPLLLLFGSEWGATGGAGAMVVSTAVFCGLWTLLLVRLRNERIATEALAV